MLWPYEMGTRTVYFLERLHKGLFPSVAKIFHKDLYLALIEETLPCAVTCGNEVVAELRIAVYPAAKSIYGCMRGGRIEIMLG